jgi:FkbM family methyltransferase
LRIACADRNQKLALHSAGRIAHGTAFVDKIQAERHGWKARKTEQVVAITLDEVLAKQRIPAAQVSAVKIDVEGAELRVLQGAARLLTEGNASVVVESNDAATRDGCV